MHRVALATSETIWNFFRHPANPTVSYCFYMNNKNVHFVALVGQDEMAGSIITLRNMKNGDQEKLNIEELIFKLSSHS